MAKNRISIFETGLVLRFLAVGVANTSFGIGVYWLLLYTGLSYQWAVALSLALGIVFGFNNHRLHVFKARGGFVRYVLVWAFIYVVNIASISVLRIYVGDYIAGVALLPVNVLLSFILMKWFVFQISKGSKT